MCGFWRDYRRRFIKVAIKGKRETGVRLVGDEVTSSSVSRLCNNLNRLA